MSRKQRTYTKTFNVRGKLVTCVNVSGLANTVGRSSQTIRRYERDGVFPDAPIRYNGIRYYPTSLARRLAPLVGEIPLHCKPDSELIVKIHLVFKEEGEKYASNDKEKNSGGKS